MPLLDGKDPRRFKRCPVCARFFIATRIDKPACSQRCIETERKRRDRARQREYENRRKLKRKGKKPVAFDRRQAQQRWDDFINKPRYLR